MLLLSVSYFEMFCFLFILYGAPQPIGELKNRRFYTTTIRTGAYACVLVRVIPYRRTLSLLDPKPDKIVEVHCLMRSIFYPPVPTRKGENFLKRLGISILLERRFTISEG